MRDLFRRLRSLAGRDRLEDGLGEEIRFHLDQQTEKNLRAGMTPAEARRQALVRFGGVEQMKEATRDEFRAAYLEDFVRDLRYGARVLRRAKAFAAVAILTLGLGLGAATAVFSVVDGILLRPLPYPDSERIVRLFQIDDTGRRYSSASEPNYEDWKRGTRAFWVMAQMASFASPVSVGAETSMIRGAVVSREFFDVMGVRPFVGRGFMDAEQRVGGTHAVIIGASLWQTRFGGAPIDGLRLRSGEASYQVVGVMPPGFDYPAGSEYWTPRELTPPQTARTAHNWQVVARLAPGHTVETARAEIGPLSRALKVQYGDATWMSDATAVPLREQLTAASRPVLLVLFGAAILLLAIACLNVSNLQLARASTRRREIALRLAVGAGSGRITRQLLAEALVLSAAAAALGVLIAWWGIRALILLQPGNLPRIESVQIDWRVFAFGIAAGLMSGALLGIATALRVSRQDIKDTLTEGARTMAGGRASERLRQGLAIAQVALTIVLLVAAGLLGRSFVELLAVDPGYRTSDVLVLDTSWTFSRDPGVVQRRKAAQTELASRLARLPGVGGVGLVSDFPLGPGFFPNGQFLEMTRVDEIVSFEAWKQATADLKARAGMAGYRVVSEGYFTAMGIPLVRGRLFDEGDGPDAPHVAVISASLAAEKWPGRDPVGRFVQFGNMDGDLRGFRIVGVVGDVREGSPETPPAPVFYANYRQRMAARFSIVVAGDRASAMGLAARRVVREVDPDLPVQIRTVDDALDRALAGRRFSLTLIGVFGGVALVLATLGIYGLISYLVAERTREIGIRLALGADARDVRRLVLGTGATLAAVGLAIGLAASLALTGVLQGMLFGVTATDPASMTAMAVVTLAAVLGASYLPARRATRVAPVVALRAE